MGVTIDSIQIEIESSSTKAAQGLDSLAKSLGELKKNGSFKTVSTNLNNLSTALNNLPNVHGAANSLRTLANSIEKLRGVGSVASLSNSLKKLPEALKGVSNINLDKVAPQLQKVADTVAPLSAIKAGGLNTMINAMSKLSKVTESLDDATIAKFAEKVELLNQKLGPLSEKMTSIKAGFGAIDSGARKASSGMQEFDGGIDSAKLNLASFITIAQTVIGVLQQVIQKLADLIHQASQWDGIKYQFGNSFGEQADEYYQKITKITDALRINKQAFMENSAMAASMLIGFGVDRTDAREMGLGYTQLAYDIWAAFNNVYETLDGADGAMAAVRSAIAGEVEPIRRAGFTIIESTLEQTAANHGLNISIENATEAQKSYLRYLELVDQAQRKGVVGTYAREMQTAEGMMRTFSQQLKSLAQAIGSLFLPILVKVMPYLQAFVELLTEGVRWLAGLFGIEIQDIGETWNDYSSGATDAIENTQGVTGALDDATKAAKELKNATLGMDELNIISPQSATGGSGGGGSGGAGGGAGGGFEGLDIESLWDESIFDNIQSDVDAIKEKMKAWLPIIGSIATAIGAIRLIQFLGDLEKVKDLKVVKWFADVSDGVKDFYNAAKLLAPEVGWMNALFPKLSGALASIGTALAAVSAPVWAAIAVAVVAVGSAVYFLIENWDAMVNVVKEFFKENIAPKLEDIKKSFEKIKEALGPVYDFVIAPLIDGIKWLVSDLSWLGDTFEWIGGIVVALVGGAFAGLINSVMSILEGVVQVASGIIQAVRGLFDVIVGIFTLDGEKISEGWSRIWSGIVDIVGGIYDATIGAIREFVEGIIDWFVMMWDELVGHSIVPDTIDAIVEWFVGLPGKVLGAVGDFVKGVVDKFLSLGTSLTNAFSSAWEAVKTWWSKKPSLASYVPSIGDIKTKLSDAWTAAKDWWDKTKAKLSTYTPSIGKIWENLKAAWETARTWWTKNKVALSTYTPSIGKIWEKLKSAWETARTWWSKNKVALSTYTPSIGKIWEKVKSSWNTAKDWWNKNKGSMSYTPSIGSIKDKVVSAWNSAKSWWKNNVGGLTTKLNISVPKLTVNWGEVSALGKTFKYPKSFSVKFAAEGGIFDKGSLIWAGERGPEVMATAAGGKTGVMNVQQMQEAVYEGVFAAMSAAMRGSGESGTQAVNIYLDGKQITASVEKRQRERGTTIMGNEVYS